MFTVYRCVKIIPILILKHFAGHDYMTDELVRGVVTKFDEDNNGTLDITGTKGLA